mmetsp:Transcript_32829/g.82808  ORF Transcript_32829/g.82808 Transcript_32829/m.82808 type:complete len:254 (+) Transcript_32829:333-1094(+)
MGDAAHGQCTRRRPRWDTPRKRVPPCSGPSCGMPNTDSRQLWRGIGRSAPALAREPRFRHFRRHDEGRPHNGFQWPGCEAFRDAKIDELDLAVQVERVACDQHVLRLQVAMDDAGTMHVRERRDDLQENVTHQGLAHRTSERDVLRELAPLNGLHHYELVMRDGGRIARSENINAGNHPSDIGMLAQLSQRGNLLLDFVQLLHAVHFQPQSPSGDHLDGHLFAAAFPTATVHGALRTGTQDSVRKDLEFLTAT